MIQKIIYWQDKAEEPQEEEEGQAKAGNGAFFFIMSDKENNGSPGMTSVNLARETQKKMKKHPSGQEQE